MGCLTLIVFSIVFVLLFLVLPRTTLVGIAMALASTAHLVFISAPSIWDCLAGVILIILLIVGVFSDITTFISKMSS